MKNRLKAQRAIHHWTQEDLAKLVSVSRQTIHALESGKYVPSTLLALKIAAVCKVSVEEIFILEEGDWSTDFQSL
jgi:putative transcriptional regulator